MKSKLMLALLAAMLGGCAIVPVGYDDGYYQGYYRDRYYRGDGYDRNDYYRQDRWRGRWGRDGHRDRYDSRGAYYRNWDRGQ